MSEDKQVSEDKQAMEASATTDYEAKAASLGWVPEDEWRGDPDKWIDARSFVEKGEQVVPILRENNRKLEREIADLKKNMNSFVEHQRKVTEREIESRIKALKAEKKDAMTDLDHDRVMQIDEDLAELSEEKKAVSAASPKPVADPAIIDFVERNQWFNTNAEMRSDAVALSNAFRHANPNADIAAELAYVEKKMRKEYPEAFGQAQRREPPQSVEGGGGGRGNGKRTSYSDLPQDAVSEFKGFVRMGAFKDTKEDRDKYAREYFGA